MYLLYYFAATFIHGMIAMLSPGFVMIASFLFTNKRFFHYRAPENL